MAQSALTGAGWVNPLNLSVPCFVDLSINGCFQDTPPRSPPRRCAPDFLALLSFLGGKKGQDRRPWHWESLSAEAREWTQDARKRPRAALLLLHLPSWPSQEAWCLGQHVRVE